MKNLWLSTLALLMSYSTVSSARNHAIDPFNTYQWNRANALADNGRVDRGDWYEWWYYKVVDPETREAFFFTYGVVNPWDVQGTSPAAGAVVQVGNFTTHTLVTQKLPVLQFAASYDRTRVQVGSNFATGQALRGQVHENGHDVKWDLTVKNQWAFNAMGWTMSRPDLSNIYWYPAQASAEVSGTITFDGRTHKFTRAPGYQDRNWGRTFPKWWTWLVSNHFTNSPGTTLAVGGGEPKVIGTVSVDGLCVGLKYKNREYVFRSIDADVFHFDIHWGVWNVEAENRQNERIEISAYAPPEKFLLLPFGTPSGQNFYDYEALLGHMEVKLYRRASLFSPWKLVSTLTTEEAGIEWGSPEPISSPEMIEFKLPSN